MRLYALIIFLSAFLLFQVQPIVARMILPWFGGTASVWTTCLLFFQIVLLLGYLYAHGVALRLPRVTQGRLHAALLLGSLLTLPILPREMLKPSGTEEPTTRILLVLLLTVGLPYFLLSTTGPLLQSWYTNTLQNDSQAKSWPYRLYAISNLGSMLALIGYPTLVEPTLTLHLQAWTWSAGYAVFALLCAAMALRPQGASVVRNGAEGTAEASEALETAVKPRLAMLLLWALLAACATSLLMSITNHLSQNVAAIPFLWVLPLSLYLLSFIVCFGGKTWEWQRAFMGLPPILLVGMAYALTFVSETPPIRQLVLLFSCGLFMGCVLCHGELARLKPHPRYLTTFYLMLSLGGALGGLFVGVFAPLFFHNFYELPISLGLLALLALFLLYREPKAHWLEPNWLLLYLLTFVYLFYLLHNTRAIDNEYRRTVRNFYGSLHVRDPWSLSDEDAVRTLTNGTIVHGAQYLNPKKKRQPITYYGPESGIGLAMKESHTRRNQRIGVIGLGTGTMAAFSRAGDVIRFYEINPQVVMIAREEFTFLSDTPAKVEIVMGDARLSMEKEPPQNYDSLVVDAFTGDAIPVHLLTKEAMALYFRHLKPDGVLIVHVSNLYLDLKPVVAQIAKELGKEARVVSSGYDSGDLSPSEWALMTARPGYFDLPMLKPYCNRMELRSDLRTWTDDYSNLFQILTR